MQGNADQNNSKYGHFSRSLRFIIAEKEVDKAMPFLDYLIRRTNKSQLKATVCRKKTNIGQHSNKLPFAERKQILANILTSNQPGYCR